MNNTFFIFYKRVINLDFLNDLIIRFKKNLYNFKKMYCEKYLLIKNLINLK